MCVVLKGQNLGGVKGIFCPIFLGALCNLGVMSLCFNLPNLAFHFHSGFFLNVYFLFERYFYLFF